MGAAISEIVVVIKVRLLTAEQEVAVATTVGGESRKQRSEKNKVSTKISSGVRLRGRKLRERRGMD